MNVRVHFRRRDPLLKIVDPENGLDVVVSSSDWQDAQAELVEHSHQWPSSYVLAGFSKSARLIASVASELSPRGLLYLGYPFFERNAPFAPLGLDDILRSPEIPTLVLQGTRDCYGVRSRLQTISMPSHVQIVWVENSPHRLRGAETKWADIEAFCRNISA